MNLPLHGIRFPCYSASSAIISTISTSTAKKELSDAEPECFKIFLLAVMVGLRRGEIDLLEWASFHWDPGMIRIEPTEYFLPKSEDSIGDVPVDRELMEVFRGYRVRRPRGRFVIMAQGAPKPWSRVQRINYFGQRVVRL